MALGFLWGWRWLARRHPLRVTEGLPAKYVSDASALETEYAHYYGKEISEGRIRSRFRQASDLAAQRNYPGASAELEMMTKDAALPVVYSNLGVLYASLGDYSHATEMFRETFARDSDYAPARQFLRTTSGIPNGAAEPFSREVESNNDTRLANLIALKVPVSGEVGALNDSVDYYRVIAPASPRDLMTVEVANHSIQFSPRVHVYDSAQRLLGWGEKIGRPGESIKIVGGPAVNSAIYISVAPDDSHPGLYVLTVTPQKAYDKYEPNDDIMSARRITAGEDIQANIMDADDTDFYSFQSPRKGSVAIEIRNTSTTLIPAVTTFTADHRNMGFGPELRKPGAGLHYSIDVEKDQLYYIQVSSQAASSGSYTLRVD